MVLPCGHKGVRNVEHTDSVADIICPRCGALYVKSEDGLVEVEEPEPDDDDGIFRLRNPWA